MSKNFEEARTFNGVIYQAHDILPDLHSYLSQTAFNLYGDWERMFGIDEWQIVADILFDFGDLPEGIEAQNSKEYLGGDRAREFVYAIAKHYVGRTEKDDEPNPNFWSEINSKYGKYFS